MTENVIHAIKIVSNQLSRKMNKFAKKFGLTGVQIQIIDYLNHLPQNQFVYQKDVEHEFNIRRSTATSVLQKMEENQLIMRNVSPSDSRIKIISALPKAEELQPQISQFLAETNTDLLNSISTFQRRGFLKALNKISNELTTEEKKEYKNETEHRL
ncbi:MarR family winged helix-turn-helix transcriptional regulator [Bombilactobacillus mellis]|uniref:MarR family winged helix-turn-helix transcriptional regulator n=1 Tax=Bombilactobacillus mellis TaxID=1218508 RepID=UPI001580AC3A|nr:MarR family winged helix-turn-helix transcriptional regulator [Bombilactobacillus mellis]MBI0107048.1 winged helix-turn-helix transcriptional regulator [Lactobacillus sp. W8086]MBI0108512.1 winged helix-turn-helix transcriptional regulator [Lactobacillus sp. W8085]MBI0111730.1 winged helix-turn-helix transcriptional regulator [Lactobacillus sp. W8088]MBI0115445.1 winged helix-turn-helix transcriptional regulator [Lactobacillus sp. W8087]MBI0119170.1 winged helix-turn-helix transcriptional r